MLRQITKAARRQVNPVNLGSRVGRALQRLQAHKYFQYGVDAGGRFWWKLDQERVKEEEATDGWYLLETNLPATKASGQAVLTHYKQLARGRGCLFGAQELPGSPSRLSLATGPGPQPCKDLLPGLLDKCAARSRMGGQGLYRRGAKGASASSDGPLGQPLSKRTTADRALLSDSPRVECLAAKDRSTFPLRFSAQVGNVGRTKNLFRSVAITYDVTLRKMD
nr:hypothetical protein [Candidatus Methylacidiphilum fumarolicum]